MGSALKAACTPNSPNNKKTRRQIIRHPEIPKTDTGWGNPKAGQPEIPGLLFFQAARKRGDVPLS
jgi:hypothetical protein